MQRVLRKLFLSLVYFYQTYLSGFFGGNCRFYPSCSHYGAEAFSRWPWPKALKLILIRMGKCHPFGPQGYDPVPSPTGVSQL